MPTTSRVILAAARVMTLREILDAAAGETPEVEVGSEPDGTVTWSIAGRRSRRCPPDGSSASFMLDPIVANAAARTPDVARRLAAPVGWTCGRGSSMATWRIGPRVVPVRPSTTNGAGRLGLSARAGASRPSR